MTLRARILAIIIAGAILPLALLGLWLAAASARSGRELLRQELTQSLERVTHRIEERWQHRSAELALLAHNAAARGLLAAGRAGDESTRYLRSLAAALSGTIREFSYRDRANRSLWSSREAPRELGATASVRAVAGFNNYDAIQIRRPMTDSAGRPLGTLEAHVLLSALLPTDSVQLIVAGSALRIRNREDGQEIGGSPDRSPGILEANATLAEPALDLSLAASEARYVEPFVRAARLGLMALLAVTGLALLLTAFFTRRVTGSLGQLAEAAGAVAAGDLERTVSGNGSTEVTRLAEAFNTMTESLRRTLRDLARGEALAAVGRFAASISHEVRNALTAVRLDLQRLKERSGPEDQRLIQRMLGNVRRLDSIVTGSLRVARTDPATMRPLLLEGVLVGAMSAAEPVCAEHGATQTLDRSAGDSLRVLGDASALEQLFLNLVINAAQAMERSGSVELSFAQRNRSAVVRIADHGRGIPAEVLDRLGEPFVSSRLEGTGLGFSIARQIAAAHGGGIEVVETGPQGTTIEVTLPACS